ncbi:MAG: helix-turn-helix transcriptional regulator [Saprospiraceae bacterium]
MKKELQEINFNNQDNPKSYFDIVKIEDLLERDLNHDIGKNHLVKFYIIFFAYEGQGYHTIDFTDYSYKSGTVLLIRKDQIHKFFRSPNVKGYLLVFTEDFIISHLNRMEALKSMQLFNDSLSFPKIEFNNEVEFSDFTILLKHLESEYNIKDNFSIGITRSVLHIVITKLFRIKAKKGHFVERKKYMSRFIEFQNLVEENCFKSKKVQYYAEKLGVSTKTLNNIVNNIVNGSSAKNFIDERTIMQIKRLLISTDHSIKEIAYISGFSDPTNFFKYFKKFAGSSPEVFRQAH